MRNQRHQKGRTPFRLIQIVLIGIAPVLASWLLIPQDLELAERLAEDGRPDRARDVLAELVSMEVLHSFGKAAANQWEYAAIQNLLSGDRKSLTHGGRKTRMLRLLLTLTDDPERIFNLFKSSPEALETEVTRDFFDVLTASALRQNKPKLASDMYLFLEQTRGLADEQLPKAIQAHRYSGSPRPALDLLYEHCHRKQCGISDLPEEMRTLAIDLHRELNEGEKAFTLLKEEFDRSGNEGRRKEILQQLVHVATESNLFTNSIPLLKDYVAKTEAGSLEWEELAARQKSHPSDADFMSYGATLAQQLLWSGDCGAALDVFRKLALFDHGEALEKCVLIAPWVNRTRDLGALLEAIHPLPQGRGYEKLIIDALCSEGEFERAENQLKTWIGQGCEGVSDMLQILADLVFEQRRYDEATHLYREAIEEKTKESAPASVLAPLHASHARALTASGKYELALEQYRMIANDQHTIKTLNDYQSLANALHAVPDVMSTLEIELRLTPENSRAPIYLEAASVQEGEGNIKQAMEWLRKGQKAFPTNRGIALKTAELLEKDGLQDDALLYLFNHFQPEDYRFHIRILELAVTLGRQGDALRFLRLSDATAKSWPAPARLALAQCYESIRAFTTALAIYENFGPNDFAAAKLRVRAQVAHNQGKLRDAWKYQAAYVAMEPDPSFDDLVFLGDLYWYFGQDEDAKAVYKQALARQPADRASLLTEIRPGGTL